VLGGEFLCNPLCDAFATPTIVPLPLEQSLQSRVVAFVIEEQNLRVEKDRLGCLSIISSIALQRRSV
jgi:hypothetical protein